MIELHFFNHAMNHCAFRFKFIASDQIQPVSLSAFVSSQVFFEIRLSQLSPSGSRGVFYLFESERGIVRRVNILCRSRRSCDLLHTSCPSSDVLSCDASHLGSSYTDEEAYERSLRAILSTIHPFAWKSTEFCDSERKSNPLDIFLSSVSQLNDPLALLRIAELAVYIVRFGNPFLSTSLSGIVSTY